MSLFDIFGHHHTHDQVLAEALLFIISQQEKTMSALDDLKAVTAKLSTDVDALIAQQGGVPEAEVAAAAAAVQAIDDKVVAAVTPA